MINEVTSSFFRSLFSPFTFAPLHSGLRIYYKVNVSELSPSTVKMDALCRGSKELPFCQSDYSDILLSTGNPLQHSLVGSNWTPEVQLLPTKHSKMKMTWMTENPHWHNLSSGPPLWRFQQNFLCDTECSFFGWFNSGQEKRTSIKSRLRSEMKCCRHQAAASSTFTCSAVRRKETFTVKK